MEGWRQEVVEGEREGKDGERKEVGWREMERGNNLLCIHVHIYCKRAQSLFRGVTLPTSQSLFTN